MNNKLSKILSNYWMALTVGFCVITGCILLECGVVEESDKSGFINVVCLLIVCFACFKLGFDLVYNRISFKKEKWNIIIVSIEVTLIVAMLGMSLFVLVFFGKEANCNSYSIVKKVFHWIQFSFAIAAAVFSVIEAFIPTKPVYHIIDKKSFVIIVQVSFPLAMALIVLFSFIVSKTSYLGDGGRMFYVGLWDLACVLSAFALLSYVFGVRFPASTRFKNINLISKISSGLVATIFIGLSVFYSIFELSTDHRLYQRHDYCGTMTIILVVIMALTVVCWPIMAKYRDAVSIREGDIRQADVLKK